jgi:Ca2+-binding RTX toxin-like protein
VNAATRRVAFLAVLAAAPAWPDAAGAAIHVSAPGDVVTVAGDDQAEVVHIAGIDDGVGKRTFVITANVDMTQSAPCTQFILREVRCQFVGVPTEVHASLGGANDQLTKDPQFGGFPPPASAPDWNLTADLGEGNDNVVVEKDGRDELTGGAGRDFVGYNCRTPGCAGGVTIDLAGSTGSDSLVGFEDASGGGTAPFASFTIVGNEGENALTGHAGNDVIEGGAGRDTLIGNPGDDTLLAVDGVQDSVMCGAGFDRAEVDAADTVGADCEDFEVFEPPPPVAISSGPSGVAGQSRARFEFTTLDASPPPGRFECSLDGGGFTSCSSPLDLVGLSDAEHVLRVRYHPDGDEPGAAAERRWRVDTVAPSVGFVSAPSGGGNPPDATIAFSASEGDVAFSCSLDGGPLFDCSSPVELRSLSIGVHDFAVDATDRAGNSSDVARVEWEVSPPPPPPPDDFACPAGRQKRVAFGVIVAVARSADACFGREPVGSAQALVSRGPVSVNGILLSPGGSTRILVDPTLSGGAVRALGQVTLSPGGLPLGWTLADGFTFGALAQGGIAALNRALENLEEEIKLAELPIDGGLKFEFSADNGGQTKITPRLVLPTASFQALPGISPEGRGLTVEVPITVSNELGLTGGIRLKLADANLFGKLKVKDLDLFYDHASRTFEGSAGIELATGPVPAQLPVGTSKPVLTAAIALGPGGLIGPLKKLSFQASKFNRHVGYGVFVQRFGGELSRADAPGGGALARWSGGAGASLGPNIRLGALDIEAISLDGTLTLDVPTGPQPPELFSVTAAGTMKIVDVPVESATVRYVPPARVELAATIDYTLFGYGIAGELAKDAAGRPLSWVSPDGFSLEARGQASLPLLGGTDPLDAVFSTDGWAACIGPAGDKVGFGRRWDGELNAMSDTCDVGPYRGGPAPASAAQTGPQTTVIPPRARVAVLSARGQGAPSRITVTGPRGERIETPAGPEGVRAGQTLLFQDAHTDTTHVVLRRPTPGRWTVTAQPGSPALVRLQVADGLPAVRLRARVTGRGRKGAPRRRTLTWRAGPLPFGQRLTFVERGPQTANVLLTTGKRRGRLTFEPDPGPGRARRIEATVTRNGIPRLTRKVARFTAPPQPRLGRVTSLRLRGRTLSWRRSPGAAGYALAITAADGARTSHATSRPRLRLPFQPRRGRLAVTILALDSQGEVGPPLTTRFRVPKRPSRPRS